MLLPFILGIKGSEGIEIFRYTSHKMFLEFISAYNKEKELESFSDS